MRIRAERGQWLAARPPIDMCWARLPTALPPRTNTVGGQETHLPREGIDLDHLTVELLAARDKAAPLGHTDADSLRCVLRRVTICAHVLCRVER